MCGIVGYIGKKKAVPVLLNGLKRVEYRGYDSAGIALPANPNLLICKKVGNVADFEQHLVDENLIESESRIGIAHTRWATHGVPSDENAHPHMSCRGHVAVVHNGIITNFSDLRRMLKSRDHVFRSQTDTEVLAHLIGEYVDKEDPVTAVRSALADIHGSYGLAVLFRDHPGVIVFARKGSPLTIGIGTDEYFVASDEASFVDHTKQVINLEDGQIGVISSDGYKVMDFNKVKVSPKVRTIDYELAQIEKAGYDHFMLKEIIEQPISLQNTLAGRIDSGHVKLSGLEEHRDELKKLQNIFFVAAGTSLNAGMIGKILLQEVCQMFSHWENASELANQNHPFFPEHSGIWAISQSGETADLMLAIKKAKKLGLPIFGLCNVVGSSVARESMAGVYTNAGPEIGVASTKAFTSQVMSLQLITLFMHRIRGLNKEPWMDQYVTDIKAIPALVGQIIEQRDKIVVIAKKYAKYKNFLFLGRGINYPVAMEGALKLKEISYLHAEGLSTGAMKHGPLAMIDEDFPTVVIAPNKDDHYHKIISNIQEITARKGPVLAIANEGDTEIADHVDDVIYVPSVTYYLLPLLFVVPLQLFAYYVAAELDCEIDQPRNLAKSVTVE